MNLKQIFETAKEIIDSHGDKIYFADNKTSSRAKRIHLLSKWNTEPIYALMKRGNKIRIDCDCTVYVNTKLKDPIHIEYSLKKDEQFAAILLEIKSKFPKLPDNQIKKLLEDYTLTEILNWHYVDNWKKFKPKETMLKDAKSYLFNNFTMTC